MKPKTRRRSTIVEMGEWWGIVRPVTRRGPAWTSYAQHKGTHASMLTKVYSRDHHSHLVGLIALLQHLQAPLEIDGGGVTPTGKPT